MDLVCSTIATIYPAAPLSYILDQPPNTYNCTYGPQGIADGPLGCRYVQPSYFGFIETCDEAMVLIQACLQGSLRFVRRRVIFSKQPAVELSGRVFIHEEKASD